MSAEPVSLPKWWQDAQVPEVRELGEQLIGVDDAAQQALGNLMLARHQETLGNLPRALNHVDSSLEGEPSELDRAMAAYLRASMLGRMGRFEEQEEALEIYSSALEALGQIPQGLENPGMMTVYRLAALGEPDAAGEKLGNLGPPADSDQFAERLFAEAVLASAGDRDPATAWREVEEAFKTLGGRSVAKNFLLLNAASIYAARSFMLEDAEGLANAAIAVRPPNTVFLPEAELARINLDLGRWDKAAEWLGRAQQAKMTLRPNYRQEAMKDLKFAVADFYLATGYPREARLVLEALENDFFRPGYTTGSEDYYLCGLYLRRCLALARELSLATDCWMRSTLGTKIRTLFPLLRLHFAHLRAKMQFRDRLVSRSRTANPGADLATLVYGPAWLLPAMAEVVGKSNFAALAEEFRPEGKRLEVLEPILLALSGKGGRQLPESAPKLLRTVNALLVEPSIQEASAVFQEAPSAFLLAGRPMPVTAAETLPVAGWLRRSEGGMPLGVEALPEGSSARLDLRSPEGTLLRSCQISWPDSIAGRLEKINLAAATSVFPLSEQTVKKIEGKALQFQNADLADN
jgi:hypothetical protein